MKTFLLGFAAAAVLFAAASDCALAQSQGKGQVSTLGDMGNVQHGAPRPYYIRLKEQADLQRQRPTEDIREVKSDPLVDALGRQIYGIVENRTLSKPQLDLRVNLLLDFLPEIKDEKAALERRTDLEGRVLSDWAEATALAVLAERLGYKATPQEVEQAIQDLSAQSAQDSTRAVQQVRLRGISEAELHREMEDGIIVEKMLRDQVKVLPDADLLQIFNKDRDVFLEPTRVTAWHLVAVMVNSPTSDKLSAIKKAMGKLGKRLKKCKTREEFVALQKEILADNDLSQDKGIRLACLDNVGANDHFDSDMLPLQQELFKQKPGSISDLFSTGPKTKPTELHIVKVIERKEGHHGTFEEAKPQIQNFMIEKLKEMAFTSLQQKYDIRTSLTGLFKYTELGVIRARPTPPARPTPRATPVATLNAPFLRGRQGGGSSLIGEPPAVETVVGARAEMPKPGAELTPEAAQALQSQGSPEMMSSLPGLPKANRNTLADDLATSSIGRLGLDNAAALQAAPAEAAQPERTAPPVQRTTTSRRRKSSRPPTNFNVAPPSVDQILSQDRK